MRLWCWTLTTGRNYSSQFCHWLNFKHPQHGHSNLAVYLSEVKKLLPTYLNLFGVVELIKQTLNSLFFDTVHVSVHCKYCDVYCREAEIMETPSKKMKGKYQSMHLKNPLDMFANRLSKLFKLFVAEIMVVDYYQPAHVYHEQ